MNPTIMKRGLLWLCASALLLVAFQAAVPISKPGQEDLTFWANHNGLEQLDVLGEVGFGDFARILMRRRSNAPLMREIRDRFTFKTQALPAVRTPDVFRAELSAAGLHWRSSPEQFVIGASQTFNLPLILDNQSEAAIQVKAEFTASSSRSEFHDATLAAHSSAAYFLRVVESEPGAKKGVLAVHAGGRDLETEVRFDVRPVVNLRVNLVDENGKPAAARVYLTGSTGLAYAPIGSISRFAAMSAEPYFHAEGSFSVNVPAGKTLIEATRGQEYEVAARTIDLESGSAPVTIQLKRWVDMAQRGWYSSDAHIHANYTADHHQTVNPQDIRLSAHAEDLNNANLMVANSGGAFLHDIQYFEGKPNALSDSRFILYWNEEMRNRGVYGHMAFFKLKHLVYPLYTGFTGTPYGEDYPANDAQAEAARKQDAAVTYVHPANVASFDGLGGAGARELPVDLALGQVDAMDVVSNQDEMASAEIWYRLLNCGFRLAISAGTDSFTNVSDHYTPGGGRVYVHSGNPLKYDDWVREYKRGRSFASNGPVIFFTVNGKEAGEEIPFAAGSKQKVRVRATVMTQVPIDKVEIIVNGQVAVARDAGNRKEITVEEELPLSRSSWVAVRATGPWHRLILNDTATFAHTSPVYVTFGDQRVRSVEDARFYDEWIEKLIADTDKRGRFATAEHRKEVIELFRRAQMVYRRIE